MLATFQAVGDHEFYVRSNLQSFVRAAVNDPPEPAPLRSCNETFVLGDDDVTPVLGDTRVLVAEVLGLDTYVAAEGTGWKEYTGWGSDPEDPNDRGNWLWSANAVAYASSTIDGGVYEGVLSAYAESTEWAWLYEVNGEEIYLVTDEKICSREDRLQSTGSASATIQIVPDEPAEGEEGEPTEANGDLVFLEAYAADRTEACPNLLNDPLDFDFCPGNGVFVMPAGMTQEAGAGASLYISYLGNEIYDGNEFVGMVPIGAEISFIAAVSLSLESNVIDKYSSATATADLAAFLHTPTPPTVATTEVPSSGDILGPFLDGVELVEEFIITVDEVTAGFVQNVFAEFTGGTIPVPIPHPTRVGETNQWRFTYDVSVLRGDSPLKITVDYGPGPDVVAEPNVEIFDPIDLELSMKPGESHNEFSDVKDIRLVKGIAIDAPTFDPSLINLPAHMVAAYEDKLDLVVIASDGTETVFKSEVLAEDTFEESVDDISVGTNRFVIKAADNYRARDVELSDEVELLSVAVPAWMSPFVGSKEFVTGGELGEEYDNPNAAGYVFNLEFPGLNNAWEATKNASQFVTAFATVLNAFLETNVTAAVHLTAYAPLVHTLEGRVVAKTWELGATIAGEVIIPPSGGNVPAKNFRALLDGKTLDLNGLSYEQTFDLVSLLQLSPIDISLGEVGMSLPLPIPLFSFKAKLTGNLTGSVTEAKLLANISIVKSGETLRFENSSLYLTAAATATLSLTAGVGVGLDLPGELLDFDVASVAARGVVKVDAKADLYVNIGGPISSPEINTDGSTATMSASYDIDWKICYFSQTCNPADDDWKKTKEGEGVEPIEPEAEDAELEGAGETESPGFPGVPPTSGDSLFLLGTIAGAESPAAALAPSHGAPLTTEVARLTLDEPLGYYRQVQFDYNALASTAPLSGQHRLEVYAVSDSNEVALHSIDLASLEYSTNENPLGYASDWATHGVAMSSASLAAEESWRLQFRLIQDSGSGEQVAVALDRILYVPSRAEMTASVNAGDISDGAIDFGPDTLTATTAELNVANTGDLVLVVGEVGIDSSAFTIVEPITGLVVLPGDSIDLQIEVADPTQAANATLTISAENPAVAPVSLTLSYNPSTQSVEVVEVIVNDGDAQRTNLTGATVIFSDAIAAQDLISSGEILAAVQVVDVTDSAESVVPLTTANYSWNGAANSLAVDLTTDGHGGVGQTLLANGRYELRIHEAHLPQFRDSDGIADAIHRVRFHRLFGDLDGNASVSLTDLATMQSNFGETDEVLGSFALAGRGDLNGDGQVNRADAAQIVSQWGAELQGSASAAPAATTARAARRSIGPSVTARRSTRLRALNDQSVDRALSSGDAMFELVARRRAVQSRKPDGGRYSA